MGLTIRGLKLKKKEALSWSPPGMGPFMVPAQVTPVTAALPANGQGNAIRGDVVWCILYELLLVAWPAGGAGSPAKPLPPVATPRASVPWQVTHHRAVSRPTLGSLSIYGC